MQEFHIGDRVRPTFLEPLDVARGLTLHDEGEVRSIYIDGLISVDFGREDLTTWPMEAGHLEMVADAAEPLWDPKNWMPKPIPYLGPQALLVLEHLRKVGTISGLEASSLYRVVDLPKRISELRAAGFAIDGKFRRDSTGKKYKRYRMGRAA